MDQPKTKFNLKKDGFLFFALFFLVAFLFLSALLLWKNTGISTLDDHFFNFKYAELYKTEKWSAMENYSWMKLPPVEGVTTSNESELEDGGFWFPRNFFQLALIPFTFFQNSILGLKIADIFLASLALTIIFFVLQKSPTKYPWLLMLLLISAKYFSFRLISGRALVLVMGLILLETYFALKKDYWKFFLVAFFHILIHPTTIYLAGGIIVWIEMARFLYFRQFSPKGIILIVLAFIVGQFSFSPLNALKSFFQNFLPWIFSVGTGATKGAALEMYPKNVTEILRGSSIVFFLLMLVGIFLGLYYLKNRKKYANQLHFQIFAVSILTLIFFLGSVMLNGRLLDFYYPLVALAGALVLNIKMEKKLSERAERILKFIKISFVALVVVWTVSNLFFIRKVTSGIEYVPVEKVSDWVEKRSVNREPIFLHNWSLFPVCFFYNDKNTYTMGTEPKILENYSPKLYWRWYNIFNYNYYCEEEKDCAQEVEAVKKEIQNLPEAQKIVYYRQQSRKIIDSIKNEFGARFVISDSVIFNKLLLMNGDLIESHIEAIPTNQTNGIMAFELK